MALFGPNKSKESSRTSDSRFVDYDNFNVYNIVLFNFKEGIHSSLCHFYKIADQGLLLIRIWFGPITSLVRSDSSDNWIVQRVSLSY